MFSEGIKRDLDKIFNTGIYLDDEDFDEFLLFHRHYAELVKTINDCLIAKTATSKKIHELWTKYRYKYDLNLYKSYEINLTTKEITRCNNNFDNIQEDKK